MLGGRWGGERHRQRDPARRLAQPAVLARLKKTHPVRTSPSTKSLISWQEQYFHNILEASKPFPAFVDEAPFAVLFCGCLADLKFFGLLIARLDHQLLTFVDKSPAATGGLHGRQAVAEGLDILVSGAVRW